MTCPDDSAIADFLAGCLDDNASVRIKEHAAGCDDCRALLSETARSMGDAADSPGSAPGDTARLASSRTIGRYVVVEILGAGAMGVVYAAYDPELDRKVALKLLRAEAEGPEGAKELQERLTREAKAMARLSHENVVMVHDAGTFDGRVFVAMELVDGESVTSWLVGSPRRWQDVLALYVNAGRGLAAAHKAGLVHRDFKPDNVLVGKDGRPRVTDFGLARSLVADALLTHGSAARLPDDSPGSPPWRAPVGETQGGVLAGTPAYMAPEQLAGKPADGRSDQFAFCVSLYEGLYGESPFKGRSLEERAREVTAGRLADPPKGSRVPPWLRRVLLRGLAAAPAERYPNMEALLLALEKRTWRVRRRVLVPSAVVAITLGALLGYRVAARERGAVCSGAELKLRGAWDAPRRREVEQAFSATLAPFAHDSWMKSARLLDEYAAHWTKLSTEACEATRLRGEQSAELLDLKVQCLDDRLRTLAGLTKVFSEADRTVVEKSIGAIEGLPSLEPCVDPVALRSAVRPPTDPGVAARVLELEKLIAEVTALERAGKYKEARGFAESAVAESRTIEYLPAEAEALHELGVVLGDLDDKGAEETLEEAVAIAEAGSHHRVAALAWIDLAYFVGYGQAHYEQGLRWLRYAAAAIEKTGGDLELEGQRRGRLGLLLWSEGKNTEALASLEQARALLEKRLGPRHLAVGKTLDAMALVYFNLGKLEEARSFDEQAVSINEEVCGPVHPMVAIALNNLGNALWRLGRYEDARVSLERSLDIVVHTVGPDHVDAFVALDSIGSVLTSMHREDEALVVLKRARAILEAAGRVKLPDYASVLNDLGDAEREKGAFQEALALHRQALAILEAAVGTEHTDVAMTHFSMGEAWLASGRYVEAVAEDEKALAVVDSPAVGVPRTTAKVLTGLGEALLGLHDAERAQKALERALPLVEDSSGEPRDLARVEFALARARWEQGDKPSALALAERAKGSFAATPYFKRETKAVLEWIASHSDGQRRAPE